MSERNKKWPGVCTLMGCTAPASPGHHHHYRNGHLSVSTCYCGEIAEPGTRPREADQ